MLVTAAQCLALGAAVGEAELLQSILRDADASWDWLRPLRRLRLLRGGWWLGFRALGDDFTRVPRPYLDAGQGFLGDFYEVRARIHRSSSNYTTVAESNDVLSGRELESDPDAVEPSLRHDPPLHGTGHPVHDWGAEGIHLTGVGFSGEILPRGLVSLADLVSVQKVAGMFH
jgi:hypothetical protein